MSRHHHMVSLSAVVLLTWGAFGCSNSAATAPETTSESKPAPKKERPKPDGKAKVVPVKFVAPKLTKAQIADGWISLFDGVSLYGWHANSNANWRVESGEIVAEEGDNGMLLTGFQIPNYEFQCDFKFPQGGNSGVFFRTGLKVGSPARDCYELNI